MTDDELTTPFSLNGKRVWVAGHTGMVGSATVRRLEKENCEILTVPHAKLDLRDQAGVAKWVERERPDVVVIAAATVGGIYANSTRPADLRICARVSSNSPPGSPAVEIVTNCAPRFSSLPRHVRYSFRSR